MFRSDSWLWFTVFVGAILFQTGINGFGLMDRMPAKLVVPTGEGSAAAH